MRPPWTSGAWLSTPAGQNLLVQRDDVIYVHIYFETIQGYGKKVGDVKDCYNTARSDHGCCGLWCKYSQVIQNPEILYTVPGRLRRGGLSPADDLEHGRHQQGGNFLLSSICQTISELSVVCGEQCILSDSLLPTLWAPIFAQVVNK